MHERCSAQTVSDGFRWSPIPQPRSFTVASIQKRAGEEYNWSGIKCPRAGKRVALHMRGSRIPSTLEGRIILRKDGVPRQDGHKKYLDEHPGSIVQNLWTDMFESRKHG